MAFYMSRLSVGRELLRLGCQTMRGSAGVQCHKVSTSRAVFLPRVSVGDANTEKAVEEQTVEAEKILMKRSASNISSHPGDSYEVDLDVRHKYPEMFPEPHMIWRNPIKEKLERRDMLARRSRIYIPEFYVGSVLRVILSNVHQPEKTSSFVGICIMREECGLRATFTLRNVIDNLGVEIKLELYDPRLQKIEVLRLERRLDTHLRYLRDAPPEYSTFPMDMRAEIRRTDVVPLNRLKVKLNPKPWTEWWHKYDYKGIENIEELMNDKMRKRRVLLSKPWEKYDLMKTYRATIPEEEMAEILTEIKDDVEEHEQQHRRRLT